jgi:signal transduction histidine kinase
MVDCARLTQAVTNLVLNAVRYTPRGGTIELCGRAENGYAVLTVTDDGVGIERERLADVFEPFTQLKADGADHGGLGIGLALVKQIVELHGGSVAARSDGPGSGCEFEIRIPLIRA